MKNVSELFDFTIQLIQGIDARYEYYKFSSGATMLDVWFRQKFFVFQFEDTFIGVSEVNNENIGFDSNPDEKFFDNESYKKKLESIFRNI